MSGAKGSVAENLAAIRQRIAAAARASGREAGAVTLVAVTKYADAQQAAELAGAGCLDLGESRPQALWDKAEQLAQLPVRWHMVGHMQRNKLRRTLPLLHLLHSLDSPRLLAALEEEAARLGRSVAALLEVNISGDAAKHGFTPSELEPLLAELPSYPHVEIRGLMGMAGLDTDEALAERQFAALRELRDRLLPECPGGTSLAELSMGMSRDFPAAIRQGATIVRIGSALIEEE